MTLCGSRFFLRDLVCCCVWMAAGIGGLAATSAAGQMGRGNLSSLAPQAPTASPAELTAYKAFTDETSPEAKIRLGEDFDESFPRSQFEEGVDTSLTFLYFNKQDWSSFYAKADRVIAINPKSTAVLELVGWVIARHYKSTDPNAAKQLEKAEKYEKSALAVVATMKKPKQVTPKEFEDSQTSLAWRAHSALGAIYFRRKDYADSAKEMQLAVKQEAPEPDSGDLYVLGVDFENLNRASDATDLFSQCSQITGDMQETCRKAYESAAHEMVESAEEAAFNAFNRATNEDTKIQLGEEFEQKYPQSAFEEQVDSALVVLYDSKRDWSKFYATADRAIAKDPNNVPVLTFVGWVIPHVYDSDLSGAMEKLDEAEKYEKHALELIPTMTKPTQLTEEDFAQAKANALARAHGGLGLVYFRRQDYENSTKELRLATTSAADADPVNLYVLGVDLSKLNRDADAQEAFTRCGEVAGDLQQQCRRDADGMKQQAAAAPVQARSNAPGTATEKSTEQRSAANVSLPAAPASDIPPSRTETMAAPLRTETIVVPVRVVVRDTNGRVVKNLKKDDFALYQDGKQETIASFAAVAGSMRPIPPDGNTPMSSAADASAPLALPGASTDVTPGEPSSNIEEPNAAAPVNAPERFIVLLFDDVHLYFADTAQVRRAAEKYLSSLSPVDRVSITTASGENEVDFTDNREVLRDLIAKLQPHPFPGASMAPVDSAFAPCPPPMTYSEADAIVGHDSGPVLRIAGADFVQCDRIGLASAEATMEEGSARARAAASRTQIAGTEAADAVFDRLRRIVRRLSGSPGQRVVVLVSPGFVYSGHQSDFADIVNLAIRNNVVINALDAKGLSMGGVSGSCTARPEVCGGVGGKWDPDRFKQFGFGHFEVEQPILRDLADSTGGMFVENNNDFAGVMREMTLAPESYYLLTYAPQDLAADGKFHVLKVNLTRRSRDTVQARRGFYAPSQAETPEAASKREIADAIFSRDALHDLPVKLDTAISRDASGAHKLAVKADIDIARLDFQKNAGVSTEDVTVAAALFDRNGNYVAGMQKVDQMNLSDATLDQLTKSGFFLELDFDVTPGDYDVRLVARDSNDGHIAAENASVSVKN
jgi:VWFA-related protein